MLAQYLALQGATDLRKSMKRSVNAVDSPTVNKDRSYPFVSGKLLYCCPKIHFTIRLQAQLCSYFALNFRPNIRLVFL